MLWRIKEGDLFYKIKASQLMVVLSLLQRILSTFRELVALLKNITVRKNLVKILTVSPDAGHRGESSVTKQQNGFVIVLNCVN